MPESVEHNEIDHDELSPSRPAEDLRDAIANEPSDQRLIGFKAEVLLDCVWLPDDIATIGPSIEADGRSFFGAYVPLALHRAELSEGIYDAAEWAAELIVSEVGASLVVAPFVEEAEDDTGPLLLSASRWNHALAMIERLDVMTARIGLALRFGETIGSRSAGGPRRLDPAEPIGFVLDTCGVASQGFVPRQIGPEAN